MAEQSRGLVSEVIIFLVIHFCQFKAPLAVSVRRSDAVVTISLTPRTWSGRGLLG